MAPKNEIEIIPPGRSQMPETMYSDRHEIVPSSPDLDGFFSSALTRWRVERRTRTMQALTKHMESAKQYFDARTAAIESSIKTQEAEYRFRDLPVVAAERALRAREEAAEQLRELHHRHELADLRRAAERAEAEAALCSATQALAAQREIGADIARRKREIEMLDLDLAAAERRAILQQHLDELGQAAASSGAPPPTQPEKDIYNALFHARAQLNAHGLDTSAIDTILQNRGAHRKQR